MNVIFMGTPDFAVPTLKGLIDSPQHTVTAVFTQPDKARGRSGKPVFTPVKMAAVENDIPVYTPERIRDGEVVERLRGIPCDVIVVAAFGQILPREILEMPRYGCINVHASLLPRWRGAAPIQWAILEGDEKTGVTTMQMDEGLDTGDMLLKKETAIQPGDTGESLHDRLAGMSVGLLLETLRLAEAGKLNPVRQDDGESCYAKMLTRELGRLDMNEPAVKLERYIRGLNPWPGTYTGYQGKKLKIWSAGVIGEDTGMAPGTIVDTDKHGFVVQTGKGCLRLSEVQLEGKKRMDAGSFLCGAGVKKGDVLCI